MELFSAYGAEDDAAKCSFSVEGRPLPILEKSDRSSKVLTNVSASLIRCIVEASKF